LATLAIIAAAACQDAVTSPQNAAELRDAVASNPPPPKIDTGATGRFQPAATLRTQPTGLLQPRFTVSGAPRATAFDFEQNAFFFSVPVDYLFNPTQNAGHLHFQNDPNGVDASSNGMVKYSHGDFSGKGILTIETNEGTLIIYLASVNDALSQFGPCGDGPCFHVFFDHATLDGVDGTVDMETGCSPSAFNDESSNCFTD
jgi:hypothetical protein